MDRPPDESAHRPFRSLALALARRYAVQDLSAKAAVVLGAWALTRAGAGEAQLALCGALLDLGVFYGVALLRERRATGLPLRRAALALALEYAPAELVDLAVRPAAMGAALGLAGDPAAALLAGSLAADAVFYLLAASLRHLRAARRIPAIAPRPQQPTCVEWGKAIHPIPVTTST